MAGSAGGPVTGSGAPPPRDTARPREHALSSPERLAWAPLLARSVRMSQGFCGGVVGGWVQRAPRQGRAAAPATHWGLDDKGSRRGLKGMSPPLPPPPGSLTRTERAALRARAPPQGHVASRRRHARPGAPRGPRWGPARAPCCPRALAASVAGARGRSVRPSRAKGRAPAPRRRGSGCASTRRSCPTRSPRCAPSASPAASPGPLGAGP